jgi:signal transduction protein with GAF and PtsI domain
MNYLSDEKSFVKYMMENGMNVVDCDKCLFYLMDDMNPGQMWSIADDELQYFPVNAGIVGYVATKVETINIVDTSTDPRFDKSHDVRSGYTTKTVLCMPIVDGRGIVVGVVQFLNKIQGVFDQTDEETISQMSNLIGPVVSSLRSAKKDGESKK